MEYSDGYLREQLPKEGPPENYVPQVVVEEVARWREHGKFEDPALLSRSAFWTYAIFSELALGNFRVGRGPFGPYPFEPYPLSLWSDLAYRAQVSVGLFDREESSGFGLLINVPAWDGPTFLQTNDIEFPRLKRRFPLAIRQTQTELHAAPNPTNATTACWAKCNGSQTWGIITAGHAVGGNRPGAAIPLDDGNTGSLARCFWQPIDAAFVHTGPPVTAPAKLPIVAFPAAGLPMTVECKTKREHRNVVRACNSMGFYQTPSYPILYYLDRPCVRGDSGALVRMVSGEAAGIYEGAQPAPDTGTTIGRVLNFAQAMYVLNTTAYL